ncbi:MAG: hypothetical protein MRZ82_01675, partial [Firmicutes bacterium]|nr:hypothetical protein [Bacillota bacterium]
QFSMFSRPFARRSAILPQFCPFVNTFFSFFRMLSPNAPQGQLHHTTPSLPLLSSAFYVFFE